MMDKLDLLRRKKSIAEHKQSNPIAAALFLLILIAGVLASALTGQFERNAAPFWMLLSLLPAFYVLFGLKIANQWEKAVVLRFGKFHRPAGPGLFFLVPLVDTVPAWVDHRVMVTPFSAEKTLTNNSSPSNPIK